MSNHGSLRAALLKMPGFLGYVLRHFKWARVALLLTVALLCIEYTVFSLMIPLATDPGAASGAGIVVRFWTAVSQRLHLPATPMTWLWLFLVLLSLRVGLGFLHVVLTTGVAKQVHRHLSEKTFRRILIDEPMTEIYRRSIGHYVTLAGDDTFRAGTLVNTALQVLAALTSVLAGFLLLYLFSPTLLLWTFGFLVLCALAVGSAFQLMLRTNQRAVSLSRESGTAYIEALNGLRSIRSMASEGFVLAGYVAQMRHYVRLLFKIDAVRSTMKYLPALLALGAGIVALWPGTERAGALTAGYIFAATTLLMRVFMALGALVNSGSLLLMDMRAASDIDELIGEAGGVGLATGPVSQAPLRSITLRDIHYRYRNGRDVLAGLTFSFRAGQTVAVVGRSGSGKSTLADMLLGLIQPDAGQIEVNDGQLPLQALRQRVVLVEQQARIFSVSVRDNLLLGLQVDDDRLWRALRLVDLETLVRGMPRGLDSVLEYQGANLSGGQRQRLGIARGLIRAPQVLILDEATSALDARTRDTVVTNLRQSLGDGILVFITHEAALASAADVLLSLGMAESETDPLATTTANA